MDMKKKLDIFEQYQIDYVWIIPFDEDFAQISADKFLDSYIMKYFNPSDIVVGYDHRFGYKREGDVGFLENRLSSFYKKYFRYQNNMKISFLILKY